MSDFESNVLGNLISNLITWGILYCVNALRNWLFSHFGHKDPRNRNYFILLLIVTWALINYFGLYLLPENSYIITLASKKIPTLPILSSVIIFYFLWIELSCFFAVGIYGADKKISKGVGYKEALNLCKNSLSFLGTGAAKLTSYKKEFEEALERCSDECPVKFLLLQPTSQKLTEVAKRAKRPDAEYRQLVLDSLRVISQLKITRNFNIEVRFYKEEELPIFRIMFIDDSLCLLSYNVFGKGDGSEFPQIHLVKRTGVGQENSFYHPASMYFERLWKEGESWDFKQYL